MEGQPPKTVISINVEIKRRQGFSKVKVKTAIQCSKSWNLSSLLQSLVKLKRQLAKS